MRVYTGSRARKNFFAGLFLCALLVGCNGDDPPANPETALHEARPVERGYVELQLFGLSVNHEPDSYKTAVAWIPIEEVMPEGSEVETGDRLLALNTRVTRIGAEARDLEISEIESSVKLSQLQTANELAQLSTKREDYEQEKQILDARIAATHRKDQAELAIAKIQLHRARWALHQAQRRVSRLRQLKRWGIDNDRQLQKSMDEFERARQSVRLPKVRLDLLETTTGSINRRLLQIDRQAVAIDLGEGEQNSKADNTGEAGEQGVFRQITALQRKQQLQQSINNRQLRRLHRHRERDARLIKDSALRAESQGVLRYREGGLRIGQKLRPASAVFILRDEDMGFTFGLPVRWRNLLTAADPDDPDTGRLFVDVPQLGITRLPGYVESISMAPYISRVGRAYRCKVMLSRPIPGLKEGMQVDCALRIAVPPGSVEIPSWAVADPQAPWVLLASGQKRTIEGQLLGHRFIVFKGLQAGQTVRAQVESEDQRVLRLSGLVRARERVDLRVPWSVEIVDMVTDGSFVEKGQIVATVVRTRRDTTRDPRQEAQILRDKAQAELAVARIEAEAELNQAYITWRKAALAVDEARLRAMMARYGSYEEEEVAGDVQHQEAQIALRAAEVSLADLVDPLAADTVSIQQVRSARLQRDRATTALTKSQLGTVDAMRRRDWMDVWQQQEKVYLDREQARMLRDAYSLQREKYQLALALAGDVYQRSMDRARRIIRRVEEETVRAPFSGYVYYNFDDRGGHREYRPLKIGRPLRTTRPFNMPVDDRRQVHLEIPVRYHHRFKVGQNIPVHITVLGPRPVSATVSAMSRHFYVSKFAGDDYLARGAGGIRTMVFTVILDLILDKEQAARVKPGITAWVELEP